MAPGRRRGSGRAAAAAAAARQKWKVGDLVLAKMKGFPPWPATVTEPEKWGFSSDRKKVLVFFYGTEQIAFCNHADIEAFTEEKKKILLNKRHGKGADFVRAVNEIIDVYDRLKSNTLDEAGSGESFRRSQESNSQKTHNNQSESLHTSTESSDVLNSEETLGASAKAEPCSIKAVHRDSAETLSILDQLRQTSLAPTNSRKRLRDAPQQSCGKQRKSPSLQRSGSSLIVDPCESEKPIVDSVDANRACDDMKIATVQQVLIVRNKPICTEQNKSGCCDVDLHISADMILSQRTDGMESETVGDEAAHLNECSLSEPSVKLEQLESGYLGKDDRFSGKLDLSMKTVILKKKRRPNRKRATNSTECVKLDNEVELKNEQRENLPDSPNSYKETTRTCWKANGDEHLPLVKRARVRMEKLHVEEPHTEETVTSKNKKEDLVHNTDKCVISSNFDVCPIDRDSSEVRDCTRNLPANHCMSKDDLISLKDCKFQHNRGTLDFEAALPPSKRLHRALKAMSANAAEVLDDCALGSKAIDMVSNSSMDLPGENFPDLLTDGKILSCTKLKDVLLSDSNNSNKVSILSPNLASQVPEVLEVPTVTSSELKPEDDPRNKVYDSSLSKVIDSQMHVQTLQTSCILSSDTQVNAASSEPVSDKSSFPGMKENGLFHLTSRPSKKEGVEPIVQNLHSSLNSRDSDEILMLKDSGEVPPVENATFVSDIISQATSSSRSDGNSGSRDLQEVTKDVKLRTNSKDMGFSTDMTPMKILIAAAQAKRLLSRSTSFTDMDGKVVPYVAVSPYLNHGDHSSEQGSSLNSMIYHRPASDDGAHRFSNGNKSPHNSMQEKGLSKFRGLDEANAARKSFEAILCTLSRTKESIGRATRLALDCAKFGIAGEVIDILVKHLERELNLYRRIDLFFLVDSITQCSHNQKGAGDVYPSLVQSLLSRLLSAAAPPGNAASENRKQCIKVLKLWLERKILPESIIQHHMKELGSVYENSFTTIFSRRPLRTERSVDDPVREMEGMLVDEYGSNTCFQLPGLLNRSVLEDEEDGSACEEKSFEAVTPERDSEAKGEKETTDTCISSKHRHILEDVDGELEMEDLAPPCEVEVNSKNYATGVDTIPTSHNKFDQQHSIPFAPPLPEDKPPSPPPLPSSPPPTAPSSSSPLHVSSVSHAFPDAASMHILNAKQNMQNQVTQPSNQNVNMIPSEPLQYCVSGYGGLQKQIPPPVSSLSSSGSYRNVSHPPLQSGTGIQPTVCVPSPNVAYCVQPPRPTLSNQFSYAQDESNKSVQSWEAHSCFTSGFHVVNNKQGGNFYGEGGPKAPIKQDAAEMGGFSPAVPPGPVPGNSEASHITRPYGLSPEPSSIPCRGWSFPPRAPNYHSSSSRPSLHSLSRVTGAPGYWRPR